MTPKNCHDGVSFSIWEKVHYKTDVFNVYKEHDRQYIFSTGGDYDYDQKKAYPGMALYHQGMNLVAVVSTGDDVWSLSVTGQLLNETWANIGVTWEPHKLQPGLAWAERGGLTVRTLSWLEAFSKRISRNLFYGLYTLFSFTPISLLFHSFT